MKYDITYILVGRKNYINGLYSSAKEIYPNFKAKIKLVYLDSECISKIEKLVKDCEKTDKYYLFFTDFFDDYAKKIAQIVSPFNKVEIINGVNLPMLIYAITNAFHILDFRKFMKELISLGKKSIMRLSGKIL